jgi:glycerol kinase
MSDKYVLAIDQGTTGTRAFIFDALARPISQSYQKLSQFYPHPGWVEEEPEEIWQSTLKVIKRVLEEGSISPSQIVAIGISNQRETTIFWERDSGRALGRAIVWQCRRSSSICQLWKKRKLESLIRERTGLSLDPYFSASKIKWFLDNLPSLSQFLRKGKVLFGTVDSYLVWKLTGGKAHLTDYTNASRTMLFNIHTLKWDGLLLETLEIPESILPRAIPSNSIFGYTGKIDPLPSGIPISGVLGDQQASLFGHRCTLPGMAKNTYGTGCFFLVNSGKKPVPSPRGFITTLACDSEGNPAYAVEGSIFVAGAVVQWLKDGLGVVEDIAQSEEFARKVGDTEGVYFVPALVGLGAPYWDTEARGAILGITRGTRKEHLIRAALEAIAYQVKDLLEVIKEHTGLRIEKLVVDGGAARNNFLMQFQSDILNLPLERPIQKEVSALGAALLAGLTIGFWDSEKINSLTGEREIFLPRMDKERVELLYQGWKQAVARILTR